MIRLRFGRPGIIECGLIWLKWSEIKINGALLNFAEENNQLHFLVYLKDRAFREINATETENKVSILKPVGQIIPKFSNSHNTYFC